MKDRTSQRAQIANLLTEIDREVSASPDRSKLDWQKIVSLLMQILPIVISFFSEPESE